MTDIKRPYTVADFVRFDCSVAWRMGYLQEHSFFDVSSLARATESYKNIRSCTECNDWKDSRQIDYHMTITNSSRSSEVLAGTRGPWWVDFCLLVDPEDRVLENQNGGFQGLTRFGGAIRQFYQDWFGVISQPSQPPPPDDEPEDQHAPQRSSS